VLGGGGRSRGIWDGNGNGNTVHINVSHSLAVVALIGSIVDISAAGVVVDSNG
jgi:hypothetical protein